MQEENPPIISNIGMGSIVVNYYRKRDPKDDFVPQVSALPSLSASAPDANPPQLDIGEPFLLDPSDESPFKAFGYVNPGQTVTTLYNNLVRAPLFRHKPSETDFLVVRCAPAFSSFSCAPTHLALPRQEHHRRRDQVLHSRDQDGFRRRPDVPPHRSPRPALAQDHDFVETPASDHRVQARRQEPEGNGQGPAAYALLSGTERPADAPAPQGSFSFLRGRKVRANAVPHAQEFMEFNRTKGVEGAWGIKKHIVVPDASEMLKRATPEEVCLAESMQVGLRHLQDAGYGQAEEGGAGDDDSKLDIEQQLAPWITTKNFINATANKAMLKLHGEGDPTGRGEAFSFLRVSMKDIFLRAGEEMATRLGTSFVPSPIGPSLTLLRSSNGESTQVGASLQRPGAARSLQGGDRAHLESSIRLAQQPRRAAVDRGGCRASARARSARRFDRRRFGCWDAEGLWEGRQPGERFGQGRRDERREREGAGPAEQGLADSSTGSSPFSLAPFALGRC